MEKRRKNDNGTDGFCRNERLGKISIIIAVIILAMGCGSPPPLPPDFLIKAGTVTVSSSEFAQELDLKLTAYPYDIKKFPEEYNSLVLDLVSTLSEESVLLAAAGERGIDISPDELAQAEAEFKKDYPEDSFKQMLLENAIPYPVWKSRLKKDGVINKLIQLDLVDKQEITPEDMIAFYKQLDSATDSEKTEALDEAGLVEQLRMEKSQASYEDWIQGLKTAYPIEIDKKAVADFLINQE